MVKQIVWTRRAQEDRINILQYWRQRNKSDTFSKKLNELFTKAVNLIQDFPRIGRETDDKKARIKIVRNYLILYQETESEIHILTIWDSRQGPSSLEKRLQSQ